MFEYSSLVVSCIKFFIAFEKNVFLLNLLTLTSFSLELPYEACYNKRTISAVIKIDKELHNGT